MPFTMPTMPANVVHPITAKGAGEYAALAIACGTVGKTLTVEADAEGKLFAYIPTADLDAWDTALSAIWMNAEHPKATVAGAYRLLNQVGNHIVRMARTS